MILITGGAFQGKTAFAKAIAEERNMHVEGDISNLIKTWMKEGKNPYEEIKALMADDAVLVMRELGCSVVPVDAFDRDYREMNGRISCILASEATQVFRVFCGIGERIK